MIKKMFILLVVLFSLASFVLSEESNLCPTSDELEKEAVRCQSEGLSYTTYVKDNGCKYVECIKITQEVVKYEKEPVQAICEPWENAEKRAQECLAKGLSYEYYYENGCKNVKCVEKTVCPGQEILDEEAMKCKEAGFEYIYYIDSEHCSRIKCGHSKISCPAEDILKNDIENCKLKGMDYEYKKKDNSCAYISCIERKCKSDIDLAEEIRHCEEKQGKVERYTDHTGCTNIKCYKDETSCRKEIIEKNNKKCVLISCSDGYTFNSCDYEKACRLECKSYRDENGCLVKVCEDGYEVRDCKEKEVKCEVFKSEDGCENKVCTDGYSARYCPEENNCKVYSDEDGCRVKECSNGYKIRECPEDKEKEVECKVYVDENNCKIKSCTNGFSVNSCEKDSCTVAKEDNGCEVKKCSNGYTSMSCPEKENVECKTISDEKSGCTIKICSDGFEAKNCEEFEKALSEAQNSGLFSGFGGFFRRLFGRE